MARKGSPKQFSADVSKFVEKAQNIQHAIVVESTQRVNNDMMTPRDKGGNFPVDTGFMRNSVAAKFGEMPSGNADPNNGPATGGEQAVTAVLIKWKPGQTIFIGIVAHYAQEMEIKYAYLRQALQKWPETVAQVTNEVRRRMKG